MLGVPELLVWVCQQQTIVCGGGWWSWYLLVDVGVECSILLDRGAIVGR